MRVGRSNCLRQWVPKPGEEDLRGFEWHYWNRQAHQEARSVRLQGLTPQERATGLIGAVSRDGTRVAGAVNDLARYTATIRVWDATSGQELWSAPPVPGVFISCSFSDNGQRLLTSHVLREGGTHRAEARVWEVKDGTLVHTSTRPVYTEPTVAFLSTDGERLFTDVREGQGNTSKLIALRVVHVSDGKELARMSVDPRSEPQTVFFIAASPDLAKVLLYETSSASGKGQLRLHEVESGQQSWAVDFAADERPSEAWFVPGRDRLLVRVHSGKGERVIVLDARDGRELSTHRLPETMKDLPFGTQTILLSGSRLATLRKARVVVYDLDRPADDEKDVSTSFVHDSNVAGVSLEPKRSRLVTLDKVGVVREWDLTPRPRLIRSFLQADGDPSRLRINADGSRRLYYPQFVSDNTKAVPRIVDASEREVGGRLAPFPPGHAHGPTASADGQTQAIVWHADQGDGLAVAWDLATGRERCRVTLGPGIWEEIALSPDGARAALLGCPQELAGKSRIPQFARIMDLNTGKVVWSSETASRCFQGVGFDPSGRHLVVSQGSDTYERRLGHRLVRCHDHGRSGSLPGGIARRHRPAAFSRDGRLVAIREQPMFAWGTATVRLFPVAPILRGESPAPLFQLTGSSHQFDCLEFSPDGSRLMAAGDSVLRLWETANGAELLIIHLKDGSLGSNCVPSAQTAMRSGPGSTKRASSGDGTRPRSKTRRPHHERGHTTARSREPRRSSGGGRSLADGLRRAAQARGGATRPRAARADARRDGAGARGVPQACRRPAIRGTTPFLRRGGRGDPAHPRRAGPPSPGHQAWRRWKPARTRSRPRRVSCPRRRAHRPPRGPRSLRSSAPGESRTRQTPLLRWSDGRPGSRGAGHLTEHRRPPLGLRPRLAPPRHVFPWR